ncbi:Zn2/Cys6 DNA-binding protein [Glarea lozoyensis ATCC 20868]|uniref:Zn2/Cys6 DNA-binding protein n=1 Tax=Glarea lozoyensis (strain ATCC 20868 / MF5171) TaxID=1116229 RepID=S3DNS5_GLAL2|nr:Zn2/Cys6 DNA-binding protein [Glarea lozoyensis ATCC 20868]EPE33746.1 Zn2/Cys6 DNA-binding protein [Glarea lozoyensis ATCC 20868]
MDSRSTKPTPAKRASCDRCRFQKIRCPRLDSDDLSDCARCRYLGIQCVYSAPLPKGRPSGSRKSTSKSYTTPKEIPLLPQPSQASPEPIENQETEDELETIDELRSALGSPDFSSQSGTWFQTDPWSLVGTAADRGSFADLAMETYTSNASAAKLSHDDIFTTSMQQLAALSCSLYTLHTTCRHETARLELQPQLVSHTHAFNSLANLLGALPSLDGYEIYTEACLVSKSLLQVMYRLRLFDSPNDESLPAALRHLLSACYVQLLHVHTILVRLMSYEASHSPDFHQGDPFSVARLRLVVIYNLVKHLLDHVRRGYGAIGLAMARSVSQATPYAGSHEIGQLEHKLWNDLQQLEIWLSPKLQTPSVHYSAE